MTLAIYVICFAAAIVLATVALPSDVRELILENCKNSRGQIRWRYAKKELRSLARFYGKLFMTTATFAAVLGLGLLAVDHSLNLEILQTAIAEADWDIKKWERNLRKGPDSVENQFTHHHISQGGSEESARHIMIFLWRGLPVFLLLCFVAVIAAWRFSSGVFNHSLELLIQDETERNRRRIQSRYHRSTSS